MSTASRTRLVPLALVAALLTLGGCSAAEADVSAKKSAPRGGPGFELVLADGTPCKGVDRPGPGDQALSCGWSAPRQDKTSDQHEVKLVTYNDGTKCAYLDDAITCDWPTEGS